MRWKWREAMWKWQLGSYCDDTGLIITEHTRASYTNHEAYCISACRDAIHNEIFPSSDLSLDLSIYGRCLTHLRGVHP